MGIESKVQDLDENKAEFDRLRDTGEIEKYGGRVIEIYGGVVQKVTESWDEVDLPRDEPCFIYYVQKEGEEGQIHMYYRPWKTNGLG